MDEVQPHIQRHSEKCVLVGKFIRSGWYYIY